MSKKRPDQCSNDLSFFFLRLNQGCTFCHLSNIGLRGKKAKLTGQISKKKTMIRVGQARLIDVSLILNIFTSDKKQEIDK